MIKNIVLDIGNVLIPFSWRQHLDHFGFSDEIKKRLADAVFLNDDWNEIDRGVLTKEELLARFIENDPGIEKEIYMVMENINGTVGEYPYTSTWVPKLKSMGYRVYLLSNFSDQQLHDSREKLPFIDQADGVLLSFRYKMIKPDDAIYQKLFELFSLKPEECLFFDDKQENIDGAVRNKMNGHVFTSYEDAMNTIKNMSEGKMAVYQLENEHIYLEVASHGAELVRLVGKKTKKEYLFDGDPKYWKRHSPILFPFVGGVKNKEYRYNGKTYTMTQHGFARDMEFTLDSQTQDTLWFSIVSNETTMENYPFTFRLEVGYQLKGTEVTVLWNVINTDTKEMYFSIGAHPAFLTSMTLEAGPDTDHLHVGDNIEGTFTCYRVTENAMALEDDTLVLPRDLPLTADLFSRDAIISKDDQASRLALAYPDGQEYVVMQFDEPIFGLWSPTSDAPFVCLEPWHGRCDADDFTGTLQERAYERMLEVGGVFNGVYTIGLPLE